MTPNQIRAAQFLAQGHTQQEAADASGVSRRSIVRWLATQEFRDLAFGLVGTSSKSENTPPPRSRTETRTSKTLEDLIPLALEAVGEVLIDPDTRNADKLKAASLIGVWAGLGQSPKMLEMEALKVLIEAGWVHDSILDSVYKDWQNFLESVERSFIRENR